MIQAWSNPVWYFFHGFAEKVHPQFYNKNKRVCLQIIKDVCRILPCPMCRHHATQYMKKISIHHVPTKQHFSTMLFNFHNFVNRRVHKKQFPKHKLSMYKNLRFIKTTQEMCYQLKRFNKNKLFRLSIMSQSDLSYINRVENSVRKHIQFFI